MKSVKLPIFVIHLVPICSFRNLPRCVIPLLPRFVIPEIYASISTPIVSIFYKPFYLQELPNKFENISYFRVVSKNFKEIKWMKDISGIFINIFCKNYLINSIISSIFGCFFFYILRTWWMKDRFWMFISTLSMKTSWWISEYLDLWDLQDEFVI